MSKLAYFFTSFVGAVPAGFGLYVFVKNFLDRGDKLGSMTMLLVVAILISVCLTLVVLSPFMILIFYKDARPALAAAGAPSAAAAEPKADKKKKKKGEDEGFDDAIPEDFDEDELKASAADDDEFEAGDDEYGGYDESELEDFDLDEDIEPEEEEPPAKKKKKK